MQRIFNLSQWTMIQDGEMLPFRGERARLVRVEVNSPAEVSVYCVENGVPQFLALVKGRDVIEFAPDGEFALAAEGGTLFIYTADGAEVHNVVLDPVIFTKIAERRRRDPAMELMMYEMQRNIEKRLSIQRAEFEALIAAREAAAGTPPAGSPTSGEGTGSGSSPEPTPEPDPADTGTGAGA